MAGKTESNFNLAPNVVHTSIPQSILDDLCSRFLINLPEEEQDDMVRVFFQIEQAHWYYVDFYCQEQTMLPSCGLREFTKIILEKFPFINKKGESMNKLLTDWKKYKLSVPVYGAILLNGDLEKCVLVQAYTSKSSWGFPRGKLNKDETPLDCAIREVLEETGFDMTAYVKNDEFLDVSIHENLVRLYLVVHVPENTRFEARTRGEIKDIQWFCVKDLPSHRKDSKTKENTGLSANSFFMVIPFIKGLRKWIGSQQRLRNLEVAHHESVNYQPQYQLQRLVESEDARLTMENKRFENDKRRHESQQRFLAEMDIYHPLRTQGYGTAPRKSSKYPSEHDQKYFKILQRPETDETLDPDRRGSPRNTRGASTSPSTTSSLGIQESNPSDSRSLSPSSNSAFTRVPSGARVSPKARRKDNNWEMIGSPSDSRRQPTTNQSDEPISSYNFLAPAWINFKFNREEFLAAIQG